MANIVAPKGFKPIRHMDGSSFNGQLTPYLIPASDGTAVGIGDVVVFAGSAGTVGQVVAGLDVEGIATVTRATAGTTGQNIAGIVCGFSVDPTNLMAKGRNASTARIAYVCTDLTVVYEVQEDAATTPLAATDIGQNIAFNVSSMNATTGISQVTLVSTSKAATATLPFKLLGLVKRPDNAFNTGGAGVDPAKFEVMLNTSALANNVAGN